MEEPRLWPADPVAVVLAALGAARARDRGAADAARMVMASRALQSRVRRRAADRLFSLSRLAAQLDARIRHARGPHAGALPADERDRWRTAALLVSTGEMDAGALPALLGIPADALVRLGGDAYLEGLAGADRLCARHAMPRWLVDALLGEHDETWVDSLLDALNQRAPLCVRARDDRAALLERLAAEGVAGRAAEYSRVGVVLDGHVNVRGLKAFRDGVMEVQDEGSQLIALVAAPRPGDRVLDACAGAGGKALALHGIEPRAHVVALEPVASRLAALRDRARRAGARVQSVQGDLLDGNVTSRLGHFDVVLVDAPCSGTGAMRREPEGRWRYTAADVDTFAATQRALLEAAAGVVKPGGRLVYATCSLLAAENERVVERLEGLEPLPIANALGEPLAGRLGARGHVLRLWPHVHGTDGFFMAAFRRTSA